MREYHPIETGQQEQCLDMTAADLNVGPSSATASACNTMHALTIRTFVDYGAWLLAIRNDVSHLSCLNAHTDATSGTVLQSCVYCNSARKPADIDVRAIKLESLTSVTNNICASMNWACLAKPAAAGVPNSAEKDVDALFDACTITPSQPLGNRHALLHAEFTLPAAAGCHDSCTHTTCIVHQLTCDALSGC